MSLVDDDRPARKPFPTDKNWAENYCFTGSDPKSGIGFWLHAGRWLQDLDIWREVVILRLPDGTVAAHRAYGNALATTDGPGGPNFAIKVIEDKRRFSLKFYGAIRRVPALAMAGGLLRDGPVQRLDLDLEFESDRAVWDMPSAGHKSDFAGTGHIEQMGCVRGNISLGPDRYRYDGLCQRDHSRGPRDSSRLGRHHWIQALFDNGIGFTIYHGVLRGQSTPAFAQAAVWEGNSLYPATVELPFMISNAIDATRPYPIALAYKNGKLDIKVTEITSTAFLSFSAPNEEYVGVFQVPSGNTPVILLEQSALYELADGTRGFGPMERSVPGEIFHEDPATVFRPSD
ncbi:MAG: hypothetical protein ABW110_06655 [Steroidobacteraceae bacterium]